MEHIREQSTFYKESGEFEKRGNGDIDMWKLFLERMLSIVAEGGILSIVLPYGILTNEGATELRNEIFNKEIIAVYEFENRNGIFPEVHRAYKFVLLLIKNTKPTPLFHAAFYLHNINALLAKSETEKILEIPTSLIRAVSPTDMAIPEFRTREDVSILEFLYRRHGRVGDGLDNGRYTIDFVRELDRTNDSGLFRRDGRGWPLVEGKNFHQFIHDYTEPEFSVLKEDGLARTKRIKIYGTMNTQLHESYRLVYRKVASSTNMRTMISCIIPPNAFSQVIHMLLYCVKI